MLHDPTHSIHFAIVPVDKLQFTYHHWQIVSQKHSGTITPQFILSTQKYARWKISPKNITEPLWCTFFVRQRKSLGHTIVQVEGAKWINGSDWLKMLAWVSLCVRLKQKSRNTQKTAYNLSQWRKETRKKISTRTVQSTCHEVEGCAAMN